MVAAVEGPGRRCWTDAPPSASQAWTGHEGTAPCATGEPAGRLLLQTSTNVVKQTSQENKSFSIKDSQNTVQPQQCGDVLLFFVL